jgi:hypothetical protein
VRRPRCPPGLPPGPPQPLFSRSEFFNLFNEAHFLFPNAAINVGNGGNISETASSARQIQFGVKLIF